MLKTKFIKSEQPTYMRDAKVCDLEDHSAFAVAFEQQIPRFDVAMDDLHTRYDFSYRTYKCGSSV